MPARTGLNQIAQNLPIVSRLARTAHRAIEPLESPFAVDHRSALLGKTEGWQNSGRGLGCVVMNILTDDATQAATVLLPSFGFAEKRGSMINSKGRLQRLNRAVRGPGQARDDWEILRDFIQACSDRNGIYSIEDVFRQMSESIPQFAGLSLSKIGDLGVQILNMEATR